MNLKKGDRGQDVVQLQYYLNNRGYSNIKIDGDFGMITESAVRDYQSKHGIPATGIADDVTLESLKGITQHAQETVRGIDVSHYQPHADWHKIKASGVSFAYIKASEGVNGKDALSSAHANGAKSVGVKIGYYHFASLNDLHVAEDSSAEAKWFDGLLRTLPSSDLPPVLDIETNKSGLSPQAVQLWIQTFLDTMKQLGHPVVILYSYTPFLDANLPHDHPFGSNPIWIAQYRNVEYPKMPHGWNSYLIWQYTNAGEVDGIGKCDNNKAPKSFLG